MEASGGTRLAWTELPHELRDRIEEAVGARVVAADSQRGGFSPGLAARCELADGRRIFIKAVSPEQNPQACRIHRREIEVASALPPSVPAPRLQHAIDDGHWVALVLDCIDGSQPVVPWRLETLDAVAPMVDRLHAHVAPTATLQTAVDRHRSVFSGWRRLHAGDGDVTALPPETSGRLARLAEQEMGWEAAAAGTALLHGDLRADNMLLTPTGAVLVDWPHACIGNPALDWAMFLPSVALEGGPGIAEVVGRYGLDDRHGRDTLITLVTAVAGFFLRAAQDPAPPGLPRLRAFQEVQGRAAVRWLAEVL